MKYLLSLTAKFVTKHDQFLQVLAYLGALGLPGSLDDGGGAPVGEDSVQDGVVDVVIERRVHRRKLDADHQRVLSGVGLAQRKQSKDIGSETAQEHVTKKRFVRLSPTTLKTKNSFVLLSGPGL